MSDGVMLHPAIPQIASAVLGPPSRSRVGQPVDRRAQAGLLEDILGRFGPEGLLGAGRHLDVVTGDPIVLALLNSESPAALLHKIERLNRYLHSHHRHRLLALESERVELEHVSTSATQPSPLESLFVCGLYLELLSRIGCVGISCAFPDAETEDRDVFHDRRPSGVPGDRTARWSIGWVSFEASRPLPGLDDLLLRDLPADLADRAVSAQVEALVLSDSSRAWKLASVASQLDVSPRTLQRRLRNEGNSFSQVVRSARVTAAQHLLSDPTHSVSEIGYLTGFADTAHFARTFKVAVGATPTEWRRARTP